MRPVARTAVILAWHLAIIPRSSVLAEPPDPPLPLAPANGATAVSANPSLSVSVSDPDGDALEVTFYGRSIAAQPQGPFSIVLIPDTQFYAASFPHVFTTQTQWIVDDRIARNVVYVAHLGDLVDDPTSESQWTTASAAMALLEDPVATLLPDGIPYGTAVGNHDQWPINEPGTLEDPGATTVMYNRYFGPHRFVDKDFFGGQFGRDNDNHYDLFSVAGMNFLVIYLEYDPIDGPLRRASLAWAEAILNTHPDRRTIVVSHYVLDPSGNFSDQGQALYDVFKLRNCVFMMLGGHMWYTARRTDSYGESTIHTMLSNYQAAPNGGNGWLRILTFFPADNAIAISTYSPLLDQYDTTSNGQFILPYDQSTVGPWLLIGKTSRVESGAIAQLNWPGREPNTTYAWYATVSDGGQTLASSEPWSFTSDGTCTAGADCTDGSFCTGEKQCLTGRCVEGAEPCSDPCEYCDETTHTCEWCLLDVDRNGWIASGDFGYFANCYSQCYAVTESCAAANFDRSEDGCIGSGDLGALAACYGSRCLDCAHCSGR